MIITQKLIDQMKWFWYQINAISVLFIEKSSTVCFYKALLCEIGLYP